MAVAAGSVLGSFAIGTAGLLGGRPREDLAARALTDGYAGGVLGSATAILDLILRYGT